MAIDIYRNIAGIQILKNKKAGPIDPANLL
jgi:hypothetical protein